MCRNIKQLFNFDPAASDDEIRASALQYVRKLSGMNKPSQVNEAVFHAAVDEVFAASRRLVDRLSTRSTPKNREDEARKARERGKAREARMRARFQSGQ